MTNHHPGHRPGRIHLAFMALALGFILAIPAVAVVGTPAACDPGDFVLCSTSGAGIEANDRSYGSSISEDGRYVTFSSRATNLVAVPYVFMQVFRKDLVTGEVRLCSASVVGIAGDGDSTGGELSADGRFVAFQSASDNLDLPSAAQYQVYRKDMNTGEVLTCSTSSGYALGNASSQNPSISADGRYVAFDSGATNLLAQPVSGQTTQVFRKDLMNLEVSLCSSTAQGAEGNGMSINPSISGSGRYVAFESQAGNLCGTMPQFSRQVVRKDMVDGTTLNCSTSTDGNPTAGVSRAAELSADGALVVFSSSSTDIVEPSTAGTQVFTRNTRTGEAVLCSATRAGQQGDGSSSSGCISADGRYVAFATDSTNLSDPPAEGIKVFRRDMVSGEIANCTAEMVQRYGWGTNNSSPSLSADGTYMSFVVDYIYVDPQGNSASMSHAVRREFATPPPLIIRMLPTSGPAGTEVTLEGYSFGSGGEGCSVTFGTGVAEPGEWSPMGLTFTVPEGETGSHVVAVQTPAGISNGLDFNVTAAAPPPPPPRDPEPPAPQPPSPVKSLSSTWYLAEGSSDWGFETYINIVNPNPVPVTALVTYMTRSGPVEGPALSLPARSQGVVNPRNDIGSTDFSTRVVCQEGELIAVDRRMMWAATDGTPADGHSSIGVTEPARTWYLPEGSSAWGFECWLLIQNPNPTAVTARVTYMIEGLGPVTVTKAVPANTRNTYNMADDIGMHDASIMVEADAGVIPERAMYRNGRMEGHDSIGVTTPATDYFAAEGTTAWGFLTYVLIQNPNTSLTDVTLTYMTPSGPQPGGTFSMPPLSRKTVRVNDYLPGTDLSTMVHGSSPIIIERAMYWKSGVGEICHDSVGTAWPHTTYLLPDGETFNGHETWTLVMNPNPVDVQVSVSYLTSGGMGNASFIDTVPANSRKTYNMSDVLPGRRAAIVVASLTGGGKIIVERAMYWNYRQAGTDTIGASSD